MSAVSFENLFFTILPGHILYMECPFGHSNGITDKVQLSSKNRRTEAVFHLNNNCSSKLQRSLNTFIRIIIRTTPVLALKSVKGGGRVFWDAV